MQPHQTGLKVRCRSTVASAPKNGGRERTCTSKAHRLSICGVCYSLLTTRPKTGAPTRNCTELIRLPSERIAENALGAVKLASLTGFAPVISCMRGRHVVWTTPQGQKWWERRVLPSLPLACQASALADELRPRESGAGERSRTVVSALARPHSAIEPHPQKWCPQPEFHQQPGV